MNNTSYINAHELTIDFLTPGASKKSLQKSIISFATGGLIKINNNEHAKKFRAIQPLSFDFVKGDRIGLMGNNGAGKTTLLRVLAGVYAPTSGLLKTSGRITALLDIALGMESESTGYENILIRGILLGISPKIIANKIDEIAEFSELGKFLNMPLRTYSSGMLLRLAFSVSTCMPSDILLMDEWLSVGDEGFSKKASLKLSSLIDEASILVLASHSKDLIKKNCTRVFISENGRFEEISITKL